MSDMSVLLLDYSYEKEYNGGKNTRRKGKKMPNWVNNDVTIKASEEDLRAFVETHIIDGKFDFSTIIPWNEELTSEEYHGTKEIKLRDHSCRTLVKISDQ